MAEHRYHFVSQWTAAAPAEAAYAAIYEVTRYPAWWPEVKEVRRLSEEHLWLRTRSLLPYDLAFDLRRTIADPVGGVLEAVLSGDLEGRIRWTIETAETAESGCRITFDENVVTNKRALNVFAPIARPAFVANHALMMSHGKAGLRTFLSGYTLGREQAAISGVGDLR
ncbi:MAG TPA: SRPBCC family protein [Candidatus Saccharimonadales bacterium]|nr:SRPBCC family protein [Candidatus Saccharimonadales bacterium]